MEKNIREILGNATMAYTNITIHNNEERKLIKAIFDILKDAKEDIEKAVQIDIKNQNGSQIDFEKIQELNNIIEEKEKIKTANSLGTICVVYSGNPYNLIEMIVKSLITHNALILVNNTSYMEATNKLILTLIKRVMEVHKANPNLVQTVETNRIEELLTNTASIKKVIVIGNKDLQEKIKDLSKIEVVTSGYDNYDLYIENNEMVQKIEGQNLNIYVKKGVKVPYENYVEVKDLEEAVGMINFNTAGYSSAIYTSNSINKIMFAKIIKTKYVAANSSPVVKTPESDIEIQEFVLNKQLLRKGKIVKNKEMEIKPPKPKEEKQEKKITEQEKVVTEPKIQTLEQIQKEIEALKEDNERLKKEKIEKIKQKNNEIDELVRQLKESQNLAKKYMGVLERSYFSRLFGNTKKSDIIKDRSLLS